MRAKQPNRFAAPDSTNKTFNISDRMIQLGIDMISIGHKIKCSDLYATYAKEYHQHFYEPVWH